MKKLLIVAGLLFLMLPGFTCDICGCSVSNYNPYLFPHLSKKYVSISYVHRPYNTYTNRIATGSQLYQSVLLTGQASVLKKIQVISILSYQFATQRTNGEQRKASGLGDATVLVNYKIADKLTKLKRQTVMAGAGVKLPSGKYTPAKDQTAKEQSFQLGTGSTDYLLNGSYRLGLRRWVLSAASSYKYNTQNNSGYRFGDVFTNSTTVVYRIDFENTSVAPYVQLTNEMQLKDADNHLLQAHSGGNVLYTGAGIDVNTKKWAIGLNYQFAAQQSLAGGELEVKPRLATHLSYSF